jgi:hypothetical protein
LPLADLRKVPPFDGFRGRFLSVWTRRSPATGTSPIQQMNDRGALKIGKLRGKEAMIDIVERLRAQAADVPITLALDSAVEIERLRPDNSRKIKPIRNCAIA